MNKISHTKSLKLAKLGLLVKLGQRLESHCHAVANLKINSLHCEFIPVTFRFLKPQEIKCLIRAVPWRCSKMVKEPIALLK
jgi:hypothetical protein